MHSKASLDCILSANRGIAAAQTCQQVITPLFSNKKMFSKLFAIAQMLIGSGKQNYTLYTVNAKLGTDACMYLGKSASV